MGWSKVKLSDILHRKRESIIIVPDEEYKLVTIKLHHKGLILRETKKGAHIKSKMSRVRTGDFLLSGIDARNGAFGIVPNELDDAIITNDFWCLVPNEKIIIKEFLLFLTSTPYFDYICNQSSDGTTQRIRLQKDKFFNYEITIPPLGEQEQILKMLSGKRALCDGINDENSHQLDLLKKLRQQILQDAVQGKLVPQDPNDEPASKLLERIKAEKEQLIREKKIKKQKPLPEIKPEEIPIEIPETWVWCRIPEISSNKPNALKAGPFGSSLKKEFYTKTGYKIYGQEQVINQDPYYGDYYIGEERYQTLKSCAVAVGDILISLVGTMGKVLILPDGIEAGIINPRLVKVSIYSEIDRQYIKYYLYSQPALSQIKHYSHGSTMDIINLGILKQILIPLPPVTEQQRIVEKIEQLMTLCDKLEQSIRQNQKFTQELLQVAMKEALEPESA